MAVPRTLDLSRRRSLMRRDDPSSIQIVAVDRARTDEVLQARRTFHLVCAALFITVLLAPLAWLAALANILRSPRVVSRRLVVGPHGITLHDVYTVQEPDVRHSLGDREGVGPRALGLGSVDEPVVLPFESLRRIEWVDDTLWLRRHDGPDEAVDLSLVHADEARTFAEELESTRAKHAEGLGDDDGDAREALTRLARQAVPVRTTVG
jgi:hypothetical protein